MNSFKSSENIDKVPFFLNKSGLPISWFQLLEAKFDFSALSSSNKFHLTISCLPPDILELLSDDLVNASFSCNPYNSLKDLLFEHYKSKPNEIIKSYFIKNNQFDMKPSHFLSKVIYDLDSNYPGLSKGNDQIIREAFINSLSPDVQKIVNGISNIELCKLADFADKIFDKQLMNSEEKFNHKKNMHSDKSLISLITEISDLKMQVLTLQTKFNQLEAKVNETTKTSIKKFPAIDFDKSVNDPNDNDKTNLKSKSLCFYHMKYGLGAKKCQLGCTYQPKSFELKVSTICIYHAQQNGDISQCVPGCTRYNS